MAGANFGVQGGRTEGVSLRLLKGKQAVKAILLRSGQQMEFWVHFITRDFHYLGFKTSDSLKRLKGRKLNF